VMTPDLTDEVVLLLSRYGWRSLHRWCGIVLWNVVHGMVFRLLQITGSEIFNTYVSKKVKLSLLQAVEAYRVLRCWGSHILHLIGALYSGGFVLIYYKIMLLQKCTSGEWGQAGCSTAPRCPTNNLSCSTRQLRPSWTVPSLGRRCLRAIFLYERKLHDNDIKIELQLFSIKFRDRVCKKYRSFPPRPAA
jgi:hypothetical protein